MRCYKKEKNCFEKNIYIIKQPFIFVVSKKMSLLSSSEPTTEATDWRSSRKTASHNKHAQAHKSQLTRVVGAERAQSVLRRDDVECRRVEHPADVLRARRDVATCRVALSPPGADADAFRWRDLTALAA